MSSSRRTSPLLKWGGDANPHFARKVHKRAIAARPFKKAAAEYGETQVDIVGAIIKAWNGAA